MIITIADLVAELLKLPQEARIFWDLAGEPIEKITYYDEIYLGDPANPKVETTDGYVIE